MTFDVDDPEVRRTIGDAIEAWTSQMNKETVAKLKGEGGINYAHRATLTTEILYRLNGKKPLGT